ncbi:MAG: SusC/RagA family TonB-linked outer membrane protein [Bacteroidaceae bacterium]|nr:SusC/RagA family TonB-linked outer membrane protein [Bacteroidaceae bacterium]
MKKKTPFSFSLRACLTVLCLFFATAFYAQNVTVKGTVTDETGQPVAGATVKVKGYASGTITDMNGQYSLSAPANGTLEFSCMGFKAQSAKVGGGNSPVNAQLAEDVAGLEEVVVTALGIKKEQKALGYSVASIDADELIKTGAPNFATALYGKAPGVRISSAPGGNVSAVAINVRGYSSITGNTQPLIVLDGVPIHNGQTNNEGYWTNPRIRSNGLVDINPEDIENISILKGAAASALYGSEAANGVVMITTKKGTQGSGTKVDFSANLSWDKVAYMPSTQTEFGPGYDNWVFGNDAPAALEGFVTNRRVDRDGNPIYTPNRETYYSYGPRYDGRMVDYFDGTKRPYNAICDDPWSEIFRTGFNQNYNLTLTNGTNRNHVRLSYTFTDVKAMQYNSNNHRHNFNLNGSFDVTKTIKLNYTAMYQNQYIKNRPYRISRLVTNYSGMAGSFTDIAYIRDHTVTSLGYKNSIHALNGGTSNTLTPDEQFLYSPMGSTSLIDEYFWNILGRVQEETHNRFIGSVNPTWEIIPGLTLGARAAVDLTIDKIENKNYAENAHIFSTNGEYSDSYGLQNSKYEIYYGDVMLGYDKTFVDKHNVTAHIGWNARQEDYYLSSVGTRQGLTQENWFNLAASVGTPSASMGRQSLLRTGLFFTAGYGFDSWAYIEGTLRQEKTSTLKKGNNSFWYPSASASLIFSELLKDNCPTWLDFGKVRASYGVVGNAPEIYRAVVAFSQENLQKANPATGGNSFIQNYIGTSVGNESIKPEQKREFELGLEAKLFKNRLGFELSYYSNTISDQILQTTSAYSMGAQSLLMNVGKLSNKGVEFAIYGTPFQNKDWRWDVRANIAKNKNEVKELADGLDVLRHMSDYDCDNGAFMLESHVGQPMGDWYSYVHKHLYQVADGSLMSTGPELDEYLENGGKITKDLGKLVGEDGLYVTDTSKRRKVGNAMPKLVGGFGTSLSWKNLTLDLTFDFRVGGDMINKPWQYYMDTGIIDDAVGVRDGKSGGMYYYSTTEDENDKGSIVRVTDPSVIANYKRGETQVDGHYVWDNGLVQDGVKADGTPNDIIVTQFEVNDMQYGWGTSTTQSYAEAIQKNSYVKCREISLAYTLPRTWTKKFACDNLTISAFARNPFYLYRTLKDFDSETADGMNWIYQAQVGGSTASARTFGFSLRASF